MNVVTVVFVLAGTLAWTPNAASVSQKSKRDQQIRQSNNAESKAFTELPPDTSSLGERGSTTTDMSSGDDSAYFAKTPIVNVPVRSGVDAPHVSTSQPDAHESSSPSRSDKAVNMASSIEELERRLREVDPKKKSSLKLAVSIIEHAKPDTEEDILAASKQVEDFALEYAQNHLNERKTATIASAKFDLQIRKMIPGRSANVRIPQSNNTESKAFMELPPDTFGNQSVYLVAVTYRDVKALVEQTVEGKRKMIPSIFAVSAKPKQKKLNKKVTILFKHPEDVARAESPACVFWRPHRFKEGGKWSKTGCSVASSTPSQTECLCDHLTMFTVLMPVQKEIPDADKVALTIISYFGLSLSIIAEIFILLAYFLFSDVTDPRSQVRANLTCALLAGQIIFLAGIRSVSNPVLCATVAFLLQYFYLAAFCWMLAEAFLLYVHIVLVFKGFELKMSLLYGFCWGFPASLVFDSLLKTLTEGPDMPGLVHQDYCWLSPENGMVWMFNATIGMLIAINFTVLICVVRQLFNLHKSPTSEVDLYWQAVKAAGLLSPLLGVTWMVGFLNFSGTPLISEYLFAILNTSQGFLIFVLHTLRNREIRRKAKRKINQWLGWYNLGANNNAPKRKVAW